MEIRPTLRLLPLTSLIVAAGLAAQTQASGPAKSSNPASSPYRNEALSNTSGSLEAQEAELRAAVAQHPDSAGLLYDLALLLRQEHKCKESLDIYTRAASHQKPTAEQLRSVALDYVLLNDYEDAIHWLDIATQMEPRNTDVLYALGRCYYSKERFADAGKVFERILAIDPRNLKAEENLGLVFDVTSQPVPAEQALRKAASWANPDGTDEWPFLDLGGFLLDQDRPQDAVEPLRAAAHIRPESPACHEKLGRALLATHDFAGGIAELERATALDAKNPRTHYELGRAYRQAGHADKAQQEFALSQKLYSTHSEE